LTAAGDDVEESAQRSGEGGWGAARAGLERSPASRTEPPRRIADRERSPAPGVADRERSPGPGVAGRAQWSVQRLAGSAGLLHRLGLPRPPRRLLRWCHAVAPALVLGSAQPDAHADRDAATRAGFDVVRRRSGGSSVLVGPGRVAWLDVVVPAGDPLWDDDVGVAPLWLGRAWADALAQLGVAGATVHAGPMERAPWSEYVCFSGTAPGEVRVPGGKVVGISQRRERGAALFQCGALLSWDAREAVAALAVDRGAAGRDLAQAAVGIEDLIGPVPRRLVERAVERAVSERGV
jgi:lipoate-protein ligase A